MKLLPKFPPPDDDDGACPSTSLPDCEIGLPPVILSNLSDNVSGREKKSSPTNRSKSGNIACVGRRNEHNFKYKTYQSKQVGAPMSRSYILSVFVLITAFSYQPIQAQDIPQINGVVGEPFVQCSPDAVYAKWRTNSTFTGNVNLRYAPDKFCYQVLVTNNQIELLIPHQECRVSRTRTFNPRGILLTASVLISFHPEYITADDRLYVLKCLHTTPISGSTASKHPALIKLSDGVPFNGNVTATMVTPVDLENEPQCNYRLLDESRHEISITEVGDMVIHEWSCTNLPDDQCLFVTDCQMRSFDSHHNLVNASGCSNDLRVMPELEYKSASTVQAFVRAFGIPQQRVVNFNCRISLVNKDSGKCPKPECGKTDARKRRDILNFFNGAFDTMSPDLEIMLPSTRSLATPPRINHCPDVTRIERATSTDAVCISKMSFSLVAASTILVAIITLVLVLYAMLKRYHYVDVPVGE